MKIIDFHTHPLYNFHLGTHGMPINLDRFKNDLVANGITQACGSVIYQDMCLKPAEDYEQIIPKLNDQALECRDILGDFYIPGIHVHPAYVDLSCRELKRCNDKGVKLIGELVPYMMAWTEYGCKEFIEIMHYAKELNMIVNMHPTTQEDLFKFSAAVPGLKIVWAHLKSYDMFEEQIEMMRRHENVYFDISAFTMDKDGSLRYIIDRVGSEKLLFGTDYPGVSPAGDIAAVLAEKLSYRDLENIFHKNAERLLGL